MGYLRGVVKIHFFYFCGKLGIGLGEFALVFFFFFNLLKQNISVLFYFDLPFWSYH